MAVVYKALDLRLGRPVALKFLAPGMESNEEARLRFLLEARAISVLDHPNVCTLYEIGETDCGRMFLAMAFVEGGTLRHRLRTGPLEPLEAALLAAQVAEGLGAAHARGIVHRDVKPGNLLLADGLVKIADFGVARLADQAHITHAGQALGTWSYMAPEQVRGEEISPAADLWSLGIVLFEMLAGRRPFRARSEPELIRKILESAPPAPGVGGPQLARILERALEKSPELRYACAREMQEDLLEAADVLAGGEPDTHKEPVPAPVAGPPRSRTEAPLLHNLPFPPLGELLKGRSEELQALAQALADEGPSGLQALVLHGLGGIGKTRLAIEYAWRFGRRHPAALFVLADSPDGLSSGIASLARPDLLDLPERASRSEHEAVSSVLRWLRENPGWLLILDKVDTREARLAVTRLLPALTRGRVIITSRRRDWPAGVRRRALDRIRLQPAAEFLLERTGEDRRRETDEAGQALRLAELLDGLPLALEQAAAYVVHNQLSLTQYLDAWQREGESVLAWYDEGVMQYPASLAITWQRSFQQLAPTAQEILRLASFLAPDPIPAACFDPGDLAALSSLSLISAQGELFAVHRLVQEVVRQSIPEEERGEWLGRALELVDRHGPVQPDDVSTWPVWDLLRPHTVQLLAYASELGWMDYPSASRLEGELGVLLYGKSLYAESEPVMRSTLARDERLYGGEDEHVAVSLTNLALLLKDTGRAAEAEPLLRRALAVMNARYGDRDARVTKQINGLAVLLIERSGWEEAEGLMRKALEIDREAHGERHVSVGRDLHNLALVLRGTGRLAEAEAMVRHSLEIGIEVHGRTHPRVARRIQILAGILRDLGRSIEAEPLAREALEIFERSLGPDHPSTQSARKDLSSLTAA
jgi:tetratricopeptide (TPR) repeat protein